MQLACLPTATYSLDLLRTDLPTDPLTRSWWTYMHACMHRLERVLELQHTIMVEQRQRADEARELKQMFSQVSQEVGILGESGSR